MHRAALRKVARSKNTICVRPDVCCTVVALTLVFGDVLLQEGDRIVSVEGELNPDGDFKKTKKKVNWLADSTDNVKLQLHEFDYLISKRKLEDGEDFKDFLTEVTHAETLCMGEPAMRGLQEHAVIQIERRGYFRVDRPLSGSNSELVLFAIPDGKANAMSVLSKKLAHR